MRHRFAHRKGGGLCLIRRRFAVVGKRNGEGRNLGQDALHNNTTGIQNTASGMQAMYANRTGGGNTASGIDALYHNTDGHYNIADGYKAGYNLTTGSYNIDIGSLGVAGLWLIRRRK